MPCFLKTTKAKGKKMNDTETSKYMKKPDSE